ncbi:TPA: LexA family protein [Proteus mirabilis]
MKFDDNFPSRVAMTRTSLNMTQDELAKKIGVVRRQVAAYEGGESKPREKVLTNLAAALGTTSEWLSHGKGVSPDLSNVRKSIVLTEIPIYSYTQASMLTSSDKSNLSTIGYIPAPLNAPDDAFAIEVQGDSMVSNNGGVSFFPGMIVTFQPADVAEIGDNILVSFDDTVTFKKLTMSLGKWYLSSLNPKYQSIAFTDSMSIIGKAIHAQVYFKKRTLADDPAWIDFEKNLLESIVATESDYNPNITTDKLNEIMQEMKEIKKLLLTKKNIK